MVKSFAFQCDGALIWSQGEKTGRLLKYDPGTKATTFITSGLDFANGVALGPDESSVLIVETTSLRVIRHWLKGPKVNTRKPASPVSFLLDTACAKWEFIMSQKGF